jgi:hypothetical protein
MLMDFGNEVVSMSVLLSIIEYRFSFCFCIRIKARKSEVARYKHERYH